MPYRDWNSQKSGVSHRGYFACPYATFLFHSAAQANLGGGIVKQRVARAGQGRSGGFRMLLAYREGHRAVFLYGFAKSERDNIGDDELQTLREIGAAWLAADTQQMDRAIRENALQEVRDDEENTEA